VSGDGGEHLRVSDSGADLLSLLDWKRRVGELYAQIRATSSPQVAWERWREERARLLRTHPASPVPAAQRPGYTGPHVYPYDPEWSTAAMIEPAPPERFELPASNVEAMAFTRFARARFLAGETELSLELYWLEGYGGGLFVPFADATSGDETYGAGRYLLDTVKGADLGQRDRCVVMDFNFAYQPSCAYDPHWACPLAPPGNCLPVPVRAGERVSG
jgi:uncharacterized protein (DUF1684 family)